MRSVLPPGSPALIRTCPFGPADVHSQLRDNGEMGLLGLPDGETGYLLTSHADVTALLGDPRFSSSVNAAPTMTGDGRCPGWFFGLDGAEHAAYRSLLTGSFTMRAVRGMEPRVQAIASQLVDSLRSRGAAADLMADFARPLPGLVMCDVLAIAPETQPEFDRKLAVLDDPAVPGGEKLKTFREIWHAMRAVALSRSTSPGDDLISLLISKGTSEEGSLATPDAAASMIFSLRLGGQAPVVHALAMGILLLLRDGTKRSVLRDPIALDRAVDEVLRYVPSNNLGVVRVAQEDASLNGRQFRAGDLVFAALPVANRDPLVFERPEEFDPERGPTPHLAFGHGAHRCLGHNLARLEISVALRTLFECLPDLRLTVPAAEIRMSVSETTYSVTELPVTW